MFCSNPSKIEQTNYEMMNDSFWYGLYMQFSYSNLQVILMLKGDLRPNF